LKDKSINLIIVNKTIDPGTTKTKLTVILNGIT